MVQRVSTAAKPNTAHRDSAAAKVTRRPRACGGDDCPVRRARSGALWLALCVLGFGAAGPEAMTSLAGAGWPPPRPDQSRSTIARHLAKPVLASRTLSDMESTNGWSFFGPGTVTLSAEHAHEGKHALRLRSPTRTEKPGPVAGRPFAETGLRLDVPAEDWSGFNRLSVRVRPHLPGFNVVSLLIKLRSEGTEGQSYTDGGLHFVLLRNHEWNRVVWEIAHLDRRQVRGVELIYRLQGNEPGAADEVQYDFDQLELERVDPDHFLGWTVAPGRFSCNQLGYAPGAVKRAFASGLDTDAFSLVDSVSGQAVWRGAVVPGRGPEPGVQVLDFTAWRQPGEYRLQAGDRVSEPFRIGSGLWRHSVEAVLDFFHAERCGWAVPGIHEICHRDWLGVNGDLRMLIHGGWHDAGDLSQGLVNTAEATYAMFRLAERLRARSAGDPSLLPLASRLIDEGRWGLDWILKTRFPEGRRITWATMDFWTDGILGTVDDVTAQASDAPFDTLQAAAACAVAGRLLQAEDPLLAARCLRTAEQDWRQALGKLGETRLELASAAGHAALELFRGTKRPEFAEKAIEFAGAVIECQETRTQPWSVPLAGFFYTSPKRDRLLHYNHRSHEQAPVVLLAGLRETFPGDSRRAEWDAAIRRYADYLKAAAAVTAPYGMLPAGVYRADESRRPEERAQVLEGVPLDDRHFLRRFPVWGDFRGNLGVQLSQALALAAAARLLEDVEARTLVEAQLDWALGRNPFAQSLMYGVGHEYAPQYTAMSGDMVGSLPVGIQSRRAGDEPYWPPSNCYNYAEVWVHPAIRWLGIMAELEPD